MFLTQISPYPVILMTSARENLEEHKGQVRAKLTPPFNRAMEDGVMSHPPVEMELEAPESSNRITKHVLTSAGTRSGVTIVL